MVTTPSSSRPCCEKSTSPTYGIKGIFLRRHRAHAPVPSLRPAKSWRPGVDFVPTYGNTLMGLATHKPFDPADNYEIIVPTLRSRGRLLKSSSSIMRTRGRVRKQAAYAHHASQRKPSSRRLRSNATILSALSKLDDFNNRPRLRRGGR